jgi:hypothetical protein
VIIFDYFRPDDEDERALFCDQDCHQASKFFPIRIVLRGIFKDELFVECETSLAFCASTDRGEQARRKTICIFHTLHA